MEIKTVAIVGMGALGMMYGNRIAQALGKNFTFAMDDARYVKHKQDVYTVNGEVKNFAMTSFRDAKPVDLVIFATKFNGLEDALQNMKNLVGPQTVFVSVLNGITSEELIKEYYGDDHLLHCVVLGMDAVREGTALTFAHEGRMQLGCLEEKQRPDLDAVCALLDTCGLAYERHEDIMRALWVKLLINVGINQTCMVYETNYGGAFSQDEARVAMYAAMHEVIAVAQKEGVNLTEADFEQSCKILQGLAPEGIPSMRQDALAKRKSEVDLFAGTIVRLGAKHGVHVPVNERYLAHIKEIEEKY